MNALDRPAKPLWFWPGRIEKRSKRVSNITVKDICADVADKYGITLTELLSFRRHKKEYTQARHETYYRCATETLQSYPTIARLLGGRCHSTIIKGARRHADLHGLDMP